MNIGIMADAHIGLCEGRHEIKTNEGDLVDSYIFGVVDNPMDFLSHFQKAQEFFTDLVNIDAPYNVFLYVTGLTSLLTASLLAAHDEFNGVKQNVVQDTQNRMDLIFTDATKL